MPGGACNSEPAKPSALAHHASGVGPLDQRRPTSETVTVHVMNQNLGLGGHASAQRADTRGRLVPAGVNWTGE